MLVLWRALWRDWVLDHGGRELDEVAGRLGLRSWTPCCSPRRRVARGARNNGSVRLEVRAGPTGLTARVEVRGGGRRVQRAAPAAEVRGRWADWIGEVERELTSP